MCLYQVYILIFMQFICHFYSHIKITIFFNLGSKLVKDLWIPNPSTEQFEFFNETLEQLYK